MSHYSVAVISRNPANVERMLEKYEEDLEVSPYVEFTKEEAILKFRNNRKEDLKTFKKALEDADSERKKDLLYAIEKKKKDLNLSDEETYEKIAQYWYGRNLKDLGDDDLIGPDGEFLSTSNPNPKWDWYTEGGRFAGLKLKGKDFDPNLNCAKISDIDFGVDESKRKDLERFWNLATGKEKPKEEDHFFPFYKPEHYINRYGTMENYVKEEASFRTYAILTPENGGTWYEPGQMGWFGMSNANIDEEREFSENYFKILDIEKYKDYYLTIIDCHI